MEITEERLHRYARHIILDEVGEQGQLKLLQSRVLVIGAGGLGSPVLMYLAAAGVGTLGVIDDDEVDITNLQRQIAHTTARVGTPKVDSAAETIAALNPEIKVNRYHDRLTPANARAIIAKYDLVADGSDNFTTRYLVNDACYLEKKPLVTAAMLRFEGQATTIKAFEEDKPCYRCIFPSAPPPEIAPRCEQAGIFGALAGVVGAMQATEVLKELLGLGTGLAGRLLLYDAIDVTMRTVAIPKNPECPLCGENPSITDVG
jgi:molybdopterin/thiamine biosynthesis adenylyltransferase